MIPTLISDITDQETGVITKRDDTQSLLPRPVDRVAFAKENPSYQGPKNSKNWLLPRLRPVRVHHAKPIPSTTSSLSASTPSSFSSIQQPSSITAAPNTQQSPNTQQETTRNCSYQGPSITSRLLRRTLPTKALGTQEPTPTKTSFSSYPLRKSTTSSISSTP